MSKNKVLLILLTAFLFLSSCNRSLPAEMPDIGLDTDPLDFNEYIKITAPKSCNTYKSGEDVCLELKNLTDNIWNYNLKEDIYIYLQLKMEGGKKYPIEQFI